MTPEELERVMNFIIERQENLGDVLQQQQQLMGTVIESQNVLTATVQQIAEAHNSRLNKHDEQFAKLVATANRHDEEFAEMRENINSLTRTVDRYITARGNNGTGGEEGR
jgi:ABC-type transporter Mla subunit MlaD